MPYYLARDPDRARDRSRRANDYDQEHDPSSVLRRFAARARKISIDKRAAAVLLAACFRVPPLLLRLSASPGSGAKLRRKQNFIADR
jgi:hypothetical protein